jgi:hypothetical protein
MEVQATDERESLLAQVEKLKAEIEARKAALVPRAETVEERLERERATYLVQDTAQVDEPKGQGPAPGRSSIKKNQTAVKPLPGRRYVLLSKSLADWGKVPQQQADLAAILSASLPVGEEVPEDQVLARVYAGAAQFPSLATSVQDPGYLLRYYLGLNKRDGKHVGFIGRNFVQVRG